MNAENWVYGLLLLALFYFAMKWAFKANTNGFDKTLSKLIESKASPKSNASMAKKHRKRLVKQTITNTADARSHHSRIKSHHRR